MCILLVIPIVGIVVALGPLPKTPSFALALGARAIALAGYLRAEREFLATCCAESVEHSEYPGGSSP